MPSDQRLSPAAAQPAAAGGKGGAAPALPQSINLESRSDLALLARGVRQPWDFPPSFTQALPNALLAIVVGRTEDKKEFKHKTRLRIAAARVLVLMHGQNQKEDPATAPAAPGPQLHLHAHTHQHAVTIEDRRQALLGRLDRPGLGG